MPDAPPSYPVDVQLAVVISRLDGLTGTITALVGEVSGVRQAAVPRSEWEQRNHYVDLTFQGQGREIGELRSEIKSRRTPWATVLSTVIAACALALVLIPKLAA